MYENGRRGRSGALIALVGVALVAQGLAGANASQTGSPAGARNIQLCHGDEVGAGCETTDRWVSAGDEHGVSVYVTDATGAPVAGVPVEIREDGPATFVPDGGDAILVQTGADGVGTATLLAEAGGVSEVVAEISPPGTSGGFRGPATHDDECERPSDTDGSPGAGNCISRPLVVSWEEEPPSPAACEDGIDNDADGWTDMEDPDCPFPEHDSEMIVNHFDVRVPRDVSLRFSDLRRDRLLVFGRVRTTGGGYEECAYAQPVNILKRISHGRWRAVATVTTTSEGWYLAVLDDRPGGYRATAMRTETTVEGGYAVCMGAVVSKRHGHRS